MNLSMELITLYTSLSHRDERIIKNIVKLVAQRKRFSGRQLSEAYTRGMYKRDTANTIKKD